MLKEVRRHDVEVEYDGRQYKGSYTVESRVVKVSSAYGSKATQEGGAGSENVARWLLHELVAEHEAQAAKRKSL